MTQLILYTSEDGQTQVQLRAERGTVWLTQLEMAELFNASKQNISLHLKNIYQDYELDPAATVKESLTVQTEGTREVRRAVKRYNLEDEAEAELKALENKIKHRKDQHHD